ncbi:MAG: methylated-DNA--[protein]-cysteine S-methyltransferase [Amylibacter sp.]|nr:methylated-DNA--[protein]-cysteine S-methyltransferase [Amylibacter sp.]
MNIASLHNKFGWFSLVEEDGRITQLLWEDRTKGFRSDVLKEGLNQLEAYFAGRLTKFDLPLAPAGTEFQKQAYCIMQDIPFGDVLTYGAMAKKLGVAAQPVGQACGSNPIPVIIPCHRIVGTGHLGGFSGKGGVETKVQLLRHEGANGQLI